MTDWDFVNTDEPIVQVFVAADLLEAGAIEQLLASNGIPAVMQSNMAPGLLPTDSALGGVGNIVIFVFESHQRRAQELIEAMLSERASLDEPCKQDAVEDPPAQADDACPGKDAS